MSPAESRIDLTGGSTQSRHCLDRSPRCEETPRPVVLAGTAPVREPVLDRGRSGRHRPVPFVSVKGKPPLDWPGWAPAGGRQRPPRCCLGSGRRFGKRGAEEGGGVQPRGAQRPEGMRATPPRDLHGPFALPRRRLGAEAPSCEAPRCSRGPPVLTWPLRARGARCPCAASPAPSLDGPPSRGCCRPLPRLHPSRSFMPKP